MNEVFVSEVQSDTLSMNYALEHPEKYGIAKKAATFGDYGVTQMNEDLSLTENYLKRLLEVDYDQLTHKQQLTYSIVKNYFESNLAMGDYPYYQECLGPTTGIQAQLPILLAEYRFTNKGDIEEYLNLLPCVYDYFEDIVAFEREKSRQGFFMNDAVANEIIDQCEAFIATPEDNFLIDYFNEKISSYTNLSDQEVASYKKRNLEAVIKYVIPAYKLLINSLTELLGTGTNPSGLYYYPEGQAYYENLVKFKVGSDKPISDMITMLDNAITKGITTISLLTYTDKNLVDKYYNFNTFPITDPEDILSDLKTGIAKDFPEIDSVDCDIKYVPEALSDYVSPAMYLVPPLDSYDTNNIYINGHDEDTLSMIYTTVAHEGYPGHLYQCVYFRGLNPAPVRNVMNFIGYDEGWATYVELYSYHLAGIDENLADFLEANNAIILCIYARADIGIQYEGWREQEVVNYVKRFFDNEEAAKNMYHTLLEEPAVYLPYALGYLEIAGLRDQAEAALGDQFEAKEFHRFLLDIGPAQFDVIEEYFHKWVMQASQ